MKISESGIELIKSFEGLFLEAYVCPAGKLTIGWGHTGKVDGKKIYKGMTITTKKAGLLLLEDIIKFEAKVNRYDKKYKWTQNQFDALVSFAFNIGSIDKLTALGTRSKMVIADKMLLYIKSNGKPLVGLLHRREIERIRFLKQ